MPFGVRLPKLIPVELGVAEVAELLDAGVDVVYADAPATEVARVVALELVELEAIGEATLVNAADVELAALVETLDDAALDKADETL